MNPTAVSHADRVQSWQRFSLGSFGWLLLPPLHPTSLTQRLFRLSSSLLLLLAALLGFHLLAPNLTPHLPGLLNVLGQAHGWLHSALRSDLPALLRQGPPVDARMALGVLVGAATSGVVSVLMQWVVAARARSLGLAGGGVAASAAIGAGGGAAAAGGGAAAAAAGSGNSGGAGGGHQPFDIPDNACYFCIRRPATSKCGSCRLVYYCCRLCQMQAWRKHRHVCGAAATAALRISRARALVTPAQWRDLTDYCDHVRVLIPPSVVVPTVPEVVAEILREIGAYVRARPEIVCQPMADAVWAAALSMRSEGAPERLHMAWAWGFLEASVESGSADAFLTALRIDEGGGADLPRVNRWMKRGLCQALLMLNKRQEVGGFFRAAPRQQLLYF